MSLRPVSYKRHRFPSEIIAHSVWLYFRFPLSLRLVEEMLLERGILVSYETIRRWALKFGADYARRLKRKAPSRSDIWHLDEVVISIRDEKRYLARRRSGRIRARRSRADPSEHESGAEVADKAFVKARAPSQTDCDRQACLVQRR
jgi:putative transposase